MKFRPCIDLHAGRVKQIVGSTLTASGLSSDDLKTNFETSQSSADFATMYKNAGLKGGHVIMLGPNCEEAAISALEAFPQGLQLGGGINPSNALKYLNAGASHIIVTSYIFSDGQIDFGKLEELVATVGKNRLVLDLSCRKRPDADINDPYYVVIDKWQSYTDFALTQENILKLSEFCDELLVHGVEVEGKRCGILEDLVQLLGKWSSIPITYAGGARTIEDLELVSKLGNGKVDLTIGSALDIFGGDLPFEQVAQWHHNHNII